MQRNRHLDEPIHSSLSARGFNLSVLLVLLSWNLSLQSGIAVTQIVAWGDNTYGQINVPSGLTNVIAISAGRGSSLALKDDGNLVQWGLINADPTHSPPAWLKAPRAIASGGDPFNLALKNDQTVVGWGGNDYGCSAPSAGLNGVVGIAAGYVHSLAVRSNGTVVAWGDNSSGQTNVPLWLSNVVAVAGGEFHSLALRSDGTVIGWGQNFYGESTGVASSYSTNGVVTLQSAVLTNVVAIAAGTDRFSLALRSDGTVVGWGMTYEGATSPPASLNDVVAIAAGSDFGMALKRDGTVLAWGFSPAGATQVPLGLSGVTAIAAPDNSALALVGSVLSAGVPVSVVAREGNTVRIQVLSESGRVYGLEYKDSLAASAWNALPLGAGNGAILTLVDPNATVTARFYRVRKW